MDSQGSTDESSSVFKKSPTGVPFSFDPKQVWPELWAESGRGGDQGRQDFLQPHAMDRGEMR